MQRPAGRGKEGVTFVVRALTLLAVLLVSTVALGRRAGAAPRAPVRDLQQIPLTLTPASGPPGTVVQVEGQAAGVSTAATADTASAHAIVCWDSCPNGPTADVDVQWSSDQPGVFSLQFTVPSAAWLTADGPHGLDPGNYTVGVLCLTPPGRGLTSGCAVAAANASGAFTLTGPLPAGCVVAGCAGFSLQPAAAAPGELVTLTGQAPVVSLTPGRVFSIQLALAPAAGGSAAPILELMLTQAADGVLAGSFRLPFTEYPLEQLGPGQYMATLAAHLLPVAGEIPLATSLFTVLAPTAFASVAAPPLRVDRSTPLNGATIAVDPLNPQRFAYCTPGAIQATDNGGATWSTVSTDGVAAAADPDLPLFSDRSGAPACVYAIPAPGQEGAFYAVFPAALPGGAPPPIFFEPFETFDGGASWRQIPPPTGYSLQGFGGLQVADAAVQALFLRSPNLPAPPYPAVEQAQPDGSWVPAQLDCPAEGACVRWGGAPNRIGSCAMNERVQPLLFSQDGGASFQSPDWPQAANACTLNEIVALASGDVLLLTGEDSFPARVSHDGGATWSALALPLLPGADASGPLRYPGLQVLPDGTLLARAGSACQPLPAGAAAWCAAAIPTTADLQSVRPIGDRLWWLDVSAPDSPVPGSTPLSTLAAGC